MGGVECVARKLILVICFSSAGSSFTLNQCILKSLPRAKLIWVLRSSHHLITVALQFILTTSWYPHLHWIAVELQLDTRFDDFMQCLLKNIIDTALAMTWWDKILFLPLTGHLASSMEQSHPPDIFLLSSINWAGNNKHIKVSTQTHTFIQSWLRRVRS